MAYNIHCICKRKGFVPSRSPYTGRVVHCAACYDYNKGTMDEDGHYILRLSPSWIRKGV